MHQQKFLLFVLGVLLFFHIAVDFPGAIAGNMPTLEKSTIQSHDARALRRRQLCCVQYVTGFLSVVSFYIAYVDQEETSSTDATIGGLLYGVFCVSAYLGRLMTTEVVEQPQ